MKANVVFRADASAAIGTGHLMRCLALAQACTEAGMQTGFLSHVEDGALARRIEQAGHRLAAHGQMGSEKVDIKATLARLDRSATQSGEPAWLVLDGYQFGPSFHDAVMASGHRLLVIDDCAHLPLYRATVLLNQNLDAASLKYRLSGDVTTLFGTDYALLRSEFLPWKDWIRSTPKTVSKMLVTLGGSDPHNVTCKVMQGLSSVRRPLGIRIVTGALNPHFSALAAEAGKWPQRFPQHRIDVMPVTDRMAEEMAHTDLAVTGAGSTAWELAFMQLPSLIITLADNQKGNARALAAKGVGLSLGWHETISPQDITAAVEQLLGHQHQRHDMGRFGRQLVDGLGAQRVASGMLQCNT